MTDELDRGGSVTRNLTVLVDSDSDQDGLPDRREAAFKLDPQSSAGDNGADGDPDGDDLTNLQEYQRLQSERPPADVDVRYLLDGGASVTKTHTVAARSRVTILAADEGPSLQGGATFGVVVSNERRADRLRAAMWWGASPGGLWQDGHASAGATALHTRWATPDLTNGYLLIANPGDTEATVRLTAYVPVGPDQTLVLTTSDVTVAARGRVRFFTLGEQSQDKQFCAEYVTRLLRAGGVEPFASDYDADLVSPGMFLSSPTLARGCEVVMTWKTFLVEWMLKPLASALGQKIADKIEGRRRLNRVTHT